MGTISPMFVGQVLPEWAPLFIDTNNAVVDLTGATLSVLITNTGTGEQNNGAGTWTITNPTAGQATYAWDAADTAIAGQYTLQVIATYSGGRPRDWLPVPWQVKPKGQL